MGKIFCLLGKSCSGKDTLFKALSVDKDLKLRPLIIYTTRPQRSNEVNGQEYYFINEATLHDYERMGKIIEQREYNTIKGKWQYCTVDDGQIDLEKDNYLLIGTLEAFQELQNYFGVTNIIPLYIAVNDEARLMRAISRERQQDQPNFDEVCRRFLADSSDFSPKKLIASGILVSYCNSNLKDCLQAVKTAIKAAIYPK
jgi:guanylate kinase